MTSIRRRLLAALLSVITLFMLAGAFATYRLARSEADKIFDYHLKQVALSLRVHSFMSPFNPQPVDNDEFRFMIQVWSHDGEPLYFSPTNASLPRHPEFGFSSFDSNNEHWRVYTTDLRNQYVQVAQPMSVREQLATTAALHTIFPFLLLLPLLGGMIWWLIGRELKPFQRISDTIHKRTPDSLEPLAMEGVPSEARALVGSLNALLQKLDTALTSQRAFVADAAHELRTPLTALQLQAQLTERASTEEERQSALAELKAGLQRAGHVVHQLLTLARQEPAGQHSSNISTIPLAELVAVVAAQHGLLAEAKQLDLGVSETASNILVQGNQEGLRTLISNLIDNAVRYTPNGGRVDIAVIEQEDAYTIEVDDSGPGIPVEDRERVFDRFFRRVETEEPGSGLGLAIVKAIASQHEATVVLADSPLGGLKVKVSIPKPPINPSQS